MIAQPRPWTAVVDRRVLLALQPLLLAAVLAAAFVAENTAAELSRVVFIGLLLIIAAIDLTSMKVPNILVYPAIAFTVAVTAAVKPDRLDEAALGGLVLFLVMLAIAIVGRGAMGMGDVKVACLSGCALGLKSAFMALALSFVLGAALAIALLLLRVRGRKDAVPLAPFLAAGAMIYAIAGGTLLTG